MSIDDRLLCFLLLCSTFFLCFHGGHAAFSARCSDVVCHGVKISYPFWKMDDGSGSASDGLPANVSCGYAGFGLSCQASNNTDPVLQLPGDSYYVRNINYTTKSLNLVDIDVVDQTCPRAKHNMTLENFPLAYNPAVDVNITFYFNCSIVTDSYTVISASPITCLDTTPGKQSYVFLEGREPEGFNTSVKCDEIVVATVNETAVSESELISQFGNVMNTGFMLDWESGKECGVCEGTGGRCGFNNLTKSFLCFCEDGSIHNSSTGGRCKGKSKIAMKVGLGVAGGVVATAAIFSVIFLLYRRRNKRKPAHSYVVSRSMSSAFSSRTDFEKGSQYYGLPIFDYEELREATNNFDPQKELGDGGFGSVFYGKLQDGRKVAVKRLYENNYKRVEQFMNEVEILAHLRHPNLVQLYGCTSKQSHRLILVYEYVANGTVADHLHGDRAAKQGAMPWSTRLNIAVETASALVYLHASDIIHRDVKTNNILLDENYSVKVADFGLSRLFPFNVTHVSTAPQGTPGYLDPEYHQCYQLTEKSDVYSFGVVLMELISSLPAVDITRHRHEINLSNLAINKIQGHALQELVDPNLGFDSNYDTKRMITAVAELGFQCLQNEKEMRPSMVEVLETLKNIQKQDDDGDNKAEERDHVILLKDNPLMLSPDSVTIKWVSTTTTPNASG